MLIGNLCEDDDYDDHERSAKIVHTLLQCDVVIKNSL